MDRFIILIYNVISILFTYYIESIYDYRRSYKDQLKYCDWFFNTLTFIKFIISVCLIISLLKNKEKKKLTKIEIILNNSIIYIILQIQDLFFMYLIYHKFSNIYDIQIMFQYQLQFPFYVILMLFIVLLLSYWVSDIYVKIYLKHNLIRYWNRNFENFKKIQFYRNKKIYISLILNVLSLIYFYNEENFIKILCIHYSRQLIILFFGIGLYITNDHLLFALIQFTYNVLAYNYIYLIDYTEIIVITIISIVSLVVCILLMCYQFNKEFEINNKTNTGNMQIKNRLTHASLLILLSIQSVYITRNYVFFFTNFMNHVGIIFSNNFIEHLISNNNKSISYSSYLLYMLCILQCLRSIYVYKQYHIIIYCCVFYCSYFIFLTYYFLIKIKNAHKEISKQVREPDIFN
jgi:hypothetical protein